MSGERSFRINPNRLDEEWLAQPERMYEYCTQLAEAKQKLNEAKTQLEVVEAEQSRDARLHPSRYRIDKITEKNVEQAVVLSAPFQQARRELIEAQRAVDVLQAAVTALENKKRALENLVHLWAMSYFAEPKAPGEELDVVREEARDRALRGAPKKRETRRGE